MDKRQVMADLIAMLKDYQAQVGEPQMEVKPSTCPLTDLPSFDSQAGVSVTVDCYSRFSLKSNPVPSLFADYNPRHHGCKVKNYTIEEVADRICGMTSHEPKEKS